MHFEFTFTKASALELLAQWGESGKMSFNQLIYLDFIYPISYSILLSSLIVRTYSIKKTYSQLQNTLVYLPFLICLFDWIENIMEVLIINNPHAYTNLFYFTHSSFATTKWLGLLFILILLSKRFIMKLDFIK